MRPHLTPAALAVTLAPGREVERAAALKSRMTGSAGNPETPAGDERTAQDR